MQRILEFLSLINISMKVYLCVERMQYVTQNGKK